jgi:hypothetical protein
MLFGEAMTPLVPTPPSEPRAGPPLGLDVNLAVEPPLESRNFTKRKHITKKKKEKHIYIIIYIYVYVCVHILHIYAYIIEMPGYIKDIRYITICTYICVFLTQ